MTIAEEIAELLIAEIKISGEEERARKWREHSRKVEIYRECFSYGDSGKCGYECPVYQRGECENSQDVEQTNN